ncbi:capsule-associated protein CAP1 [Podochytrium sp. JEL0797]|nr:capsule-associated protein CAP1 [Podochytrium sp. JEL0797]
MRAEIAVKASLHIPSPPPGYNKWLAFSEKHGCQTNLEFYAQIYRDLEPFENDASDAFQQVHNMNSTAEFVENAASWWLPIAWIEKAYRRAFLPTTWRGGHFTDGNQTLMSGIAHLFDRPFKFVLSDKDEPQMLPSDHNQVASSTDDAESTYTSVTELFEKNSCLDTTFDASIRASHGFFQAPDTFQTRNSRLPLFSQAKTHCFRDIVFPMRYHVKWAITKVVDPVPWERKESALFWRGGSTGGSYHEGKPWKQYHRSRLVEWAQSFATRYPDMTFDAGLELAPKITGSVTETRLDPGYVVDIGFSNFVQTDVATLAEMNATFGLKTKVPFEVAVDFKYLIVVELSVSCFLDVARS